MSVETEHGDPGESVADRGVEQAPRVSNWPGSRFGGARLRAALSARTVPRHSITHYAGGVMLFLLALLVSSGILLLLYYVPDAAQAHGSVEQIIGELPYGKLVRATHLWASDLLIATLFFHTLSVLIRRSFRAPNELAWLLGLVLLFLGVGLAFTGAILPWSQTAQTDARIGSNLAQYVPFVGDGLRRFMRGGDEVTSSTLGHAFGFHVGALPAVLTAVLALHLLLLALRRPAQSPVDHAAASRIPLYPDFFVRGAALTTAVLVVTMTLTVFVERPLGAAAALGAPSPAGARPPWYFLPVHEIVSVAPKEMLGMDGARFLVGLMCALGLVAAALPFIDRRGSKVTAWVAVGLALVLFALSARALN